MVELQASSKTSSSVTPHPEASLHINAETLRNRPVLKAIFPEEFYRARKAKEPRAEQDASNKATSSADKSIAVAKVASMRWLTC